MCRIKIISDYFLNITSCNIEIFFGQIFTHILFSIVEFLVIAIEGSNNR